MPEGHTLRGVSSLVGPDGVTRLQWIKTREEREEREELLARLVRDLPTQTPVRSGKIAAPKVHLDDDLLAVLPMGDPHLGLLAWAPESGDDHDLKIGEELLQGAIVELVGNAPRAKHALIANLGDFFHSDNSAGVTSRSGHSLDVDSRWAKVLRVGLGVMVFMIDECLRTHATVRVINEQGNHDDHSAVFLAVALNAHYRNEPRVTIDLSPSRFHYHEFGANLIGVTHGHSIKHDQLESIMAHDQREAWGRTKHRHWLVGHIHTSRRYEFRGCTVETFRTLAAKDAWTSEQGYRSARDMSRIVLHREFGEVGRTTASVDLIRARRGAA